jgi:hypothetical protein
MSGGDQNPHKHAKLDVFHFSYWTQQKCGHHESCFDVSNVWKGQQINLLGKLVHSSSLSPSYSSPSAYSRFVRVDMAPLEASMLTVLCTVDVIAPKLPLRIITTPLCGLVACNILAHYYWACTIPPGFPDEHARLSGTRSRPEAAWRAYFLAPERSRDPNGGAQWTQDDLLEWRPNRCKKCSSLKPEVRVSMCVTRDT